jgi:hypothetical protein
MDRPARALQSGTVVSVACAVSFGLGLLFIFVWAPHPWSWEGFDHYHDLARELAAGRPFPTLDVPWGYAYFLAFFYRLFGDRPWIPLIVQAALNASVPLLTWWFASTWLDRAAATAAAALTGLFSFNTVYASTQSSDAVCTWLFMAAIVVFARAAQGHGAVGYAVAGGLLGVAAQFRPNLILLPVTLAAYVVWRHAAHRWRDAVVLVAASGAMLVPWVVRNYRLTHELLPTSVHGAVQLWYGTLQVGPYRDSRAHNPRAIFEAPAFDYTSLTDVPLVVSAVPKACAPGAPQRVSLTYWTDRAPTPIVLDTTREGPRARVDIPPPRGEAVLYYYFTATWPGADRADTPPDGAAAPFVYFVTRDHLGDQDVHGDLVDVFDLVRAARAAAWNEAVPNAARLAALGLRSDDPGAVARVLADHAFPDSDRSAAGIVSRQISGEMLTLRFADGSEIVIPHRWSGRITDLAVSGAAAQALMHTSVRVDAVRAARAPADTCLVLEGVEVNQVFYRREPHFMRRYAALAWDNIRRDPIGFATASALRAVRLFVVYGTDDPETAQQFKRSRMVYVLAAALSGLYFVAFACGVFVAWRHRYAIVLPLLLVLYVPATIAPVLTNMRYTVTVQPVMFMFIAAAVTARSNANATQGRTRQRLWVHR